MTIKLPSISSLFAIRDTVVAVAKPLVATAIDKTFDAAAAIDTACDSFARTIATEYAEAKSRRS